MSDVTAPGAHGRDAQRLSVGRGLALCAAAAFLLWSAGLLTFLRARAVVSLALPARAQRPAERHNLASFAYGPTLRARPYDHWLVLDGLRGVMRLRWNDHGTQLRDAQVLVARQYDVTGLLVDEFYDGGAYAAFGRDVPMVRYGVECLPNPLFNYVIAGHAATVKEAEQAGFRTVRRVRDVAILRR